MSLAALDVFVDALEFVVDNRGLVWDKTVEHLALSGAALAVALVIAVPIGFANVMVALVVLAVPPILTNAYVAVDEVDVDAVEAARGMGMTGWQILRRVEIPLATPLLFAGIRTATVFVVASATIAAIAGGGGLGDIIVNQASYRLEGVIGASLVVSGLAFAADGAVGVIQRLLTPAPLRARREVDAGLTADVSLEGARL